MLRRHSAYFASLAVLALAAACGNSDDPDRTGPVSRSTALIQYATCDDLETDLKDMLRAETDYQIEQRKAWADYPPLAGSEGDAATDGAGANAPTDDSRTEGEDFSGTNNQEDGVDEGDFVKTDGYHVYTLNGNRLHIFATPEFGELVPKSVTEIEGQPREMLVNREAGRAVVFSQIYPWSLPEGHPMRELLGIQNDDGSWYPRVYELSKLTVLDISDTAKPTLLRELYVEGWYQTARMVEGSVRMGAYGWIQLPGLDQILWNGWNYMQDYDTQAAVVRAQAYSYISGLELGQMVPRLYERSPNGEVATLTITEGQCRSFYRPTNSHARGIASIYSLDLFSSQLGLDADHVVSNYPTFYASKDYLYIAENAHDWWWFWWNQDHTDMTNIHTFDISQAGRSLYVGSGRVDGYVLDQFSMGEHEGYLRVATTTNRWNRWWEETPPEPENHVFVLGLAASENPEKQAAADTELEVVGHVGGIAKNESIFSARFKGDKGYVVTFRNIDPLFTIDLSNPRDPVVAGELEIPGFSTYIHPIADGRLLTMGVGGDENGANWQTQVSMFDVSDFENPALQDVEVLAGEQGWGWSEAQYEHKAFQYWAPKKLLAVPMSTYKNLANGNWEYLSRLELITVDTGTGLGRHGSIDHSHFFNADPNSYWYYTDVRRSIFMGEFIYAISDRGITVHHTDTLTEVTEQSLPGYTPNDYYWWW